MTALRPDRSRAEEDGVGTGLSDTPANRGRLYGIALGLCIGLALLLAPSALATQTLSGTVNAVTPDGSGGYYAAGSFTVPSSTIVNAVHIKSDGTIDTSWAPNPSGAIYALAVSGSDVYLGGNFTLSTLHNAARVDATSGALDTGWTPQPDGTVRAIAVLGQRVYLGGSFTQVSTSGSPVNRSNAAAVDLSDGYDAGWDPSPDNTVYALATSGSTVYLGGSFLNVNSDSVPVARDRAAAVDYSTGLATDWNPSPDGPIYALATSGLTVYLGGSFNTISGGVITSSPRIDSPVQRPNAAAVSAATGNDTGWNPAPNGQVNALAVSRGTVYLGGLFSKVKASASTTADRADAAGVDAVTGYDTGWDAGVSDTVNSLATWYPDVYIGGAFGIVNTTVAQHSLTVHVPPTGSGVGTESGAGSVTSDPVGINCPGGSCSTSYDHGSQVTLTATPAGGSGFAGWSGGGCSGTSTTCIVTLDANTTVTATFNTQSTLTVTLGANSGSVTSAPAGISCPSICSGQFTDGTQVTLMAAPANGFSFSGWFGGTCTGDVTSTCQFTMPNGPATVNAIFAQTHVVSVTRVGNGSGAVTSSPLGIDCPNTNCAQPFDDGTDVVLYATPYPGSRFAGWTSGCSGTGPCELIVGADTQVQAVFLRQHTLTVSRNGSGTGTVSGSSINCGSSCGHTYDQGTVVTLSASAASGSTFTGWTGGGCAGTHSTCNVTVSSDAQVTATFTAGGKKPPPPPPPPPKKKPAPRCTLKGGSSRVLLAAPRTAKGKGKKKAKAKPGTLTATVHCDRATTVTLSGVITELVGKKPKHGKQRTKTFRLGPVRAAMAANGSKTLTFSLSRSALSDLKHKAKMSLAMTLTATGASGHVTATMARLSGY
jgi:hypothetical protein